MTFTDAGYVIALVNPRDQPHPRAAAWEAYLSDQLVVTEYVLVEVFNFLSKPASRGKAHALIARLRAATNYELIPAAADLFEAGLQLHAQRPDKEWSLTDCISFVVMQRRGITRALTHDIHFEQAGFEALLRRDPTP
jgi:hypothetical protein